MSGWVFGLSGTPSHVGKTDLEIGVQDRQLTKVSTGNEKCSC